MLVHFYFAAGTVNKRSVYNAALKLRWFCPSFMTHEFKTGWMLFFFLTCCRDKKFVFPHNRTFLLRGSEIRDTKSLNLSLNIVLLQVVGLPVCYPFLILNDQLGGRCGGLMVSALDSRASSPGLSPSRWHCCIPARGSRNTLATSCYRNRDKL